MPLQPCRPTLSKVNMIFLLILLLLAVWNLPHTIALRHLIGLVLLILVFTSRFEFREFRDNCRLLPAFFIYLVLHLLFLSSDFSEALNSFKGEWLKLILFSLIGWGGGVSLRHKSPTIILLATGLACCIPLLVHIVLTVNEGLKLGSIPWGYWGINEIHGDLGYTALSASILLGSLLLFQKKTGKYTNSVLVILLIVCIVSPLLAKSRGGYAFVVITLFFMMLLHVMLTKGRALRNRGRVMAAGLAASMIIMSSLIAFSSDEDRWSNITNRVSLATLGDPIILTCKGLPYLQEELAKAGIPATAINAADIYSVGDGDGLRMLLLRTSLHLIPEYPLGINGSKDAYRIAISRKCDPAIIAFHLHNGWLDTALAIGIPGAILYFLILLSYARQGFRKAKRYTDRMPYAVALLAMSVLWLLRSLFDSAQRDQMLEMQIFLLTFLAAISTVNKAEPLRAPEPPTPTSVHRAEKGARTQKAD